MNGGRVGVAGGRGFIGAHVVASLDAAGALVEAFGREGAPLDPDAPYDAIVWAAGRRSNDATELEAAHVAAPLAALARVRTGGGGRFVYCSSGEVYGPAEVPFREAQPADPRSAYAQAKLRGEAALAAAAAAAGVTLTVLRLAVVYGPGQGGAMLLPSLLAALRAGTRVPMTRGEQTRDFVHVDDVAAAVQAALAPGAPGGLYNVGSSVETRVADAATRLARAVGGEPAVALLGLGDLPYREGEQMRYLLDGAQARAGLGFGARVGLAEGLARLAAS